MIRAVIVTLPAVRVQRGQPACRACPFEADEGRHTTTVAECGALDGSGCPDPGAHHPYQPLPWWRRVRRRKAWEGW